MVDIFIDSAKAEQFQRAFETSPYFSATVSSAPGGSFSVRAVRQTSLHVAAVGVSFFDRFGLAPLLGRTFNEADQAVALALTDANSGVLPVIVSHTFWVRDFGADPSVVGREAVIAERNVVIVGVMAQGVKFPGRTDVWTPRARGFSNIVRGFAQLSPGTTIEQVRAAFPLLDFESFRDSLRPPGAIGITFIFGTTLALLLLAWVQISGLLLAGASDRWREVAVRLALGATDRRIAREFASEAIWLAGAACALSWLVVPFLTVGLIALLPGQLTADQYLQPDWRAFAFGVVVTSVGVLSLIVASSRLARRSSPSLVVQEHGGDSVAVAKTWRLLLIVQTGCTALMLYLAALTGFSYLNVVHFNYGFDAENVVIIEPPFRPPPGVRGKAFAEYSESHFRRVAAMTERLNALGEVMISSQISDTPIARGYTDTFNDVVRIDGRTIDPISARIIGAGDDILEALGATLLTGTSFSDPGNRGQKNVVVINETLARKLSSIVPAIGSRVATQHLDATIIGIVRDLVDSKPDAPADPLIFQPAQGGTTLVVRTTSRAEDLMPLLRQTVETEFGPMRSTELRLMSVDVDNLVDPWRGRAAVLSVVAALGLPLAIVGLGCGMMFFVRARTRDIGVRLAVGAAPSQARAVVLAYARRIAGIGTVVGVGAGALVGHLMSNQLFGLGAVSPVTTIAVALLIAGAAFIAAYFPARRASQVDPVVALRAK